MSWCQFCLPVPVRHEPSASLPLLQRSHLFALAFPHRSILCSCSSVQASRSTDLTRLMCVPMPRCIPEHLDLLSEWPMPGSAGQPRTECKRRFRGSSLPILGLCGKGMSAVVSRVRGYRLFVLCPCAYACSSCNQHRSYCLQASVMF